MRQDALYALTYDELRELIRWSSDIRPQSTDIVVLTSAGNAMRGAKENDTEDTDEDAPASQGLG